MRGYEHVATDVPTWVMTAANRTMAAAAQLTAEVHEIIPESMLSRYLTARLRAMADIVAVRYTMAGPSDPAAMSQEALVKRVEDDRLRTRALVEEVRAAVPTSARSPALDDSLDSLRLELHRTWTINFEEERRG